DEPGIHRVRKGKRFEYLGPDGKLIRDPAVLDRIRSLVIPPAWKHVWITARPRGHMQATGRDARGRKQHLYHPRWREVRDRNKFDRMAGFARVLPRIRSRVSRDMSRNGLPKEKVVATVIRLLETTFARVGNEEYAKENKSFGLTTLRDRHVDVRGATVRFVFRGKSGVEVQVGITNRGVAHKLGHTRAVCRRSYVHPVVIDTYLDGRLEAALSTAVSRIPARLKSDEAAVLSLVRRKARRNAA